MNKRRVIVALLVIAGALSWILVSGLRNSLVYYRTPTELLRMGRSALGEPTRLGGFVVPGSVRRAPGALRFVVSDGTTRLSVICTSGVPSLFRSGQGVVLEGHEAEDGAFHADTVLVKHNGVYRPPAPGETPHSADLSVGRDPSPSVARAQGPAHESV
ncbi:MAG: cytochrome c maturation protein CcmE [Actinomycetota bacterium]